MFKNEKEEFIKDLPATDTDVVLWGVIPIHKNWIAFATTIQRLFQDNYLEETDFDIDDYVFRSNVMELPIDAIGSMDRTATLVVYDGEWTKTTLSSFYKDRGINAKQFLDAINNYRNKELLSFDTSGLSMWKN